MPSWNELQKNVELSRVLRAKPQASPSVMDNYQLPKPQVVDPAADAIGPPTIGGVSIDPTDYVGPGLFKNMATVGAKLMGVGAINSFGGSGKSQVIDALERFAARQRKPLYVEPAYVPPIYTEADKALDAQLNAIVDEKLRKARGYSGL